MRTARRPAAIPEPFWAVSESTVRKTAHLWTYYEPSARWGPVCCRVLLQHHSYLLVPDRDDVRCKDCLRWLAHRPGRFPELEGRTHDPEARSDSRCVD